MSTKIQAKAQVLATSAAPAPAAAAPEAFAQSQRRRWLLVFLLTPIVALAATCVLLKLHRHNLSIPIEYGHDSFLVTVPVKTMLEKGWWYENDQLGAPAKMEFYDYPSSPNLHIALLKVLSLVEHNAFRLTNYYYLLSFPIIAILTLAAFKALGLEALPSSIITLLFTLSPYHFWRGISHLWLACYLTVPLAMILIAWVLRGRSGLFIDKAEKGWRLRPFSAVTWVAILMCAALGFDFPYYPAFAAFFLVIAGAYASVHASSWLPMVRSSALVGAIAFFFALNLLPNVLYRISHGKNESPSLVTHRNWRDAEMYGLTIAQLMMPAQNHPIRKLEQKRQKYFNGTIAPSEGSSPALGTVATYGFLSLIAWLLLRQNKSATDVTKVMDWMSMLNAASLLLATIGGFSAVLNLLLIGALRGYNRISIFILFFSLVPVGIWLAILQKRYNGSRLARLGFATLVALIAVGGMYEQSRYFRIVRQAELAEFHSDREFVESISQQVGEHGRIFQYPVQNFLSYIGPAIAVDPYSHFRGYLHSSGLTWSFGAVTGRRGAEIQNSIESQPLDQALKTLTMNQFDGIYVDRKLYKDGGAEMEVNLLRLLGEIPTVSKNERLAFFPLTRYRERLKSQLSPDQYAALEEESLHPVLISWQGADVEEVYPTMRFRWCLKSDAILKLDNLAEKQRKVVLKFGIATSLDEAAHLQLKGGGLDESLAISATPVTVEREVTLHPGKNEIYLHSDAKPLVTPVRNVTFRVCEFEYRVTGDGTLASASSKPIR